MAALRLQKEEILAEKVQGFPVLYELKVLKKKNAVQNAWEKSAKNLDFAETGNFFRASSN